ncbi:hypothetical protein [Actinoplanes sp. NBRC 101535]|uniref:adenosine deaminase family protein n=1 Tax=Actinoplanes sp. NBRC 101535 TaxID=3032196 RepID=UPI0024A14956|nr:hypothetical protein [Actinoplanes sp. NBRC 101535]GLY06631.1 adenine deaminase [Actinoplanes sp. NBRC 101535]
MSTISTADDWRTEESGPVDAALHRILLCRRLPRAELHLHLTGALRPSVLARLGYPVDRRHLDYGGVESFFAAHRDVAAHLRDAGVLREVVEHVLDGAADTGCRHVELSVNASEFGSFPNGLTAALAAIGAAFESVRRRLGLSGGIIVAADRAHDPSAGLDTVHTAAIAREHGAPVLGIGNDGFPAHRLAAFAGVYDEARHHGFRTTGHANKPRDVPEALDLGLDRVDHAWELQGRPELQRRFAEAGTPVTMAMTSCLMMLPGRFPAAAAYPLDEVRRAGVRVTLNTDDAAMFFTDSAQEHLLAATTYDWDPATLADITTASLEAAWIEPSLRPALLAAWRTETRALLDNPRCPDRGVKL